MSTDIKYPRGSEWRKWDLHIHSDCGTAEEIIDTVIDKGISVFTVTDHNNVDKINEFLGLIEKKQSQKKEIHFLPGVEIRTDKGKHSVHLIGIFPIKDKNNISIDSEYLKQNLLARVGYSDAIIIDAGKKALGESKKTEDYRKRGLLEIAVNFEKAAEQIKKLGGITIVHAGTKSSGLETEMHHSRTEFNFDLLNSLGHTKRELMEKHIDICEIPNWHSSNIEERDFYLKEFGKPSIVCSDSHKKTDIGDRYTWIKADPTFEGLKQLLYEPYERVYLGTSPPSGKTSSNVIDRIEIKDSKNWFDKKPVFLNENLVAIIGEKGAGKTALADFTALAGGDFDVEEASNDPGSFVFKALKSTKQIGETIKDCTVTIYWKDGNHNKIKITDDLSDYKKLKKVRYLSQCFIERKCHPEQAEELQEEIENIIFQHIPMQDRLEQTTFLDLKELKTKSIKLKQISSRKIIADLNDVIFNLEVEINSLDAKKAEKSKLQADIKQLENQKPKPTTQEEKDIEGKLNLLNNRHTELNEKIASYKAQLATIETIKVQVSELKEYVEEKLADIKDNLKTIDLANILDKIKFSVHNDFNNELDKKEGAILTQIKSLQGAEIKGDSTGKKDTEDINLDSLTSDYINGLALETLISLIDVLESKSSIAKEKRKIIKAFEEQIRKNQKRISELEKDITNIETLKKPLLPKKEKERGFAYQGYFKLLIEEKKVLEEIYSPLKEKLSKKAIGQDNKIEFFARLEFNINNFFNKANSIIDFRRGKYFRGESTLLKAIKNIADKIELVEDLDIYNHMFKLYQSFEKDNGEVLKISDQLSKGKKKIDFYNWIFDVSDFKVTYSIKYHDTNIELLSPGKKGIVLLLMYLALDTESSIPLIIDQPEENLDNKSVYTDLINFFRTAKKRRQILIITHNPNLVLNTDSEQVIVANFEAIPNVYKSRLTYISGAIENSFIDETLHIPLLRKGIREHGVDILEGGKDAFIKRKDKYDY